MQIFIQSIKTIPDHKSAVISRDWKSVPRIKPLSQPEQVRSLYGIPKSSMYLWSYQEEGKYSVHLYAQLTTPGDKEGWRKRLLKNL